MIFDPNWFEAQKPVPLPPCMARSGRGGVELEIAHALEPWHVLGETGAIGGTVRYVDSSTERLQVRAVGLVEGRHVIACNGRRVAHVPDRDAGRGRRRRALQGLGAVGHAASRAFPPMRRSPSTCSTCGAGARLAAASIMWRIRAGANYDDVPVNAYEAEARRKARFQDHGHTPGPNGAAAGGDAR